MSAVANWAPLVAAAAIIDDTAALSLHPVMSDNMEPQLRIGRHMVVVKECSGFEGEGMYRAKDGSIHAAERRIGRPGHLSIWSYNKVYGAEAVSEADFAEMTAGRVVASIEMHDFGAMDRLWSVATAARREDAYA